ncbi:MAG: hypothetical protein KF870_07330 [Leadbetterella sp.]|nr:hypothetical protein [Leadbetterella sp.]
MLEKAINIATKAHKGQKDKAEQPYILHLIRVMLKGKTEEEQICGMLHDLLEDTNWTADDLKKEGFPESVIQTIQTVTKLEGETYDDFIGRILLDETAIRVKINDLEDNMAIRRLTEITPKDAERLNKYLLAYKRLTDKSEA